MPLHVIRMAKIWNIDNIFNSNLLNNNLHILRLLDKGALFKGIVQINAGERNLGSPRIIKILSQPAL